MVNNHWDIINSAYSNLSDMGDAVNVPLCNMTIDLLGLSDESAKMLYVILHTRFHEETVA